MERKAWHAAVHKVSESDMTNQLNWTDASSTIAKTNINIKLLTEHFHVNSLNATTNSKYPKPKLTILASSFPYPLAIPCPNPALFIPWLFSVEKAMATHSSTLTWKIPWMEEPGRLQSMGSCRVGLDWVTSLSLFTFMHWRRKWQPTSVFLPGESQGQRSLVGCCLWGRTELDTTEAT